MRFLEKPESGEVNFDESEHAAEETCANGDANEDPPAIPRRNSDRKCKVNIGSPDRDVKDEAADKDEHQSSEEGGEELSAPTFKIGRVTTIDVPKSFTGAQSGPWSKWW